MAWRFFPTQQPAARRQQTARQWRSAMATSILLLGFLAGTRSFAAEEKDEPDTDDMPLAEKAAERHPQPVVVGTLIHRTVLEPLESQPTLGHVNRLVRAGDGTIKVIVDYGGFFGFGTKPIAVPVEAMVLAGHYMEIVDFTPAQLKDFPAFDGAGTKPVAPDETIKVGLARPSH